MANQHYFKKFVRQGIAFMDGAELADLSTLCTGNTYHILDDYDFIEGEDNNFAVFHVLEVPGIFYFGNSVVNDILSTIAEDGMKTALADMEVKFSKHVSKKKNREYIAMEFVFDGE